MECVGSYRQSPLWQSVALHREPTLAMDSHFSVLVREMLPGESACSCNERG
jgi:hypothetical protein